jgi:epoxyqueuosine reductase QueG
MDRDMICRAPQQAEPVAVTKGYIEAAVVGMVLSHYIRALGYEARNHMDGSYLVVAPLVAQAAGLGEIGRSGLLITKEYGPRVRLGVVTTNLPLVPDEKKDFGIAGLCEDCKRCATSCPAKAIPDGGRTDYNGCLGWEINSDRCFANWQRIGTDCGICLAACPLSDDIPSEMRDGLAHSPDSRAALLAYCDGKRRGRPYISGNPDWMR